MKTLKNAFLNSIIVLLLLQLVFAGALLLNGIEPRIVVSGSMEPAIKTGSLAFVDTNRAYDSVEPGNVVVYRSVLGTDVLHRAINVTDNGIETKGDANELSDGISTTRENFIGVALFAVPYLGFVVAKLQSSAVIIAALIIISISAFIVYIAGIPTGAAKSLSESDMPR